MSGTVRTLRGKLSDGTVVEVRNAAGWDVYSWIQRADGTWKEGQRGGSHASVRSRTISLLGHWSTRPNFEVIYMAEIIPPVIEQYFAEHHPDMTSGIRIEKVYIANVGWVEAIPGGMKIRGTRPVYSWLRLLARHYHVEAICVSEYGADFQLSDLGLRLPKRSAA